MGHGILLNLVPEHNHSRYFVNGKLVNEAADLNATEGKILFLDGGCRIYYRNILIATLKLWR